MSFIKTHWLGLISGFIIFCFLVMFVLVLLSPRLDAKKRGFIPCTEAMAETMLGCPDDGRYSCMFKAILGNSWCDMKVIGSGLKKWAVGKQSYPWSNYIFVPELPQDEDFDEQARAEYLKNNSDITQEMQNLKILHEELENEQQNIGLNPEDLPE